MKKKRIKILVTVDIEYDDDFHALSNAIATAREDAIRCKTGGGSFINTPVKAQVVDENRPTLTEIRNAFEIVDKVNRNEIKILKGKRYHNWVMKKEKKCQSKMKSAQ